jgi:NAD(P)-dependent dehydrogenase (short-subunit alcohol dehydrogenase family)/MFS family permease
MNPPTSLFSLDGKVAVITGGTASSAAASRPDSPPPGERRHSRTATRRGGAKAEEIRTTGARAMALMADVLDEAQIAAACDDLLTAWGRVDVLVNAAGGNVSRARSDDRPVFDVSIDAFDEVLRLNLHGTVVPSMRFGEAMGRQRSGVILNISSMAATRAISGVLGYSVAKAGIDSFTRWLAVEMARKYGGGVRVNAIAPGFFIAEQNRGVLLNADGSFTTRALTIMAHTPWVGSAGPMSSPPRSSGSAATRHPSSRASSFPSMAVSAHSAASDLAEGAPAAGAPVQLPVDDRRAALRGDDDQLSGPAGAGDSGTDPPARVEVVRDDYGAIVSWFSLAYGVGLLLMGRVLDRIGVRRGFSAAIVVWSAAAAAHALARTVGGFSLARAALGLGEAGNFPGAVKAVAEWFPKKERAFATGIFNAGSNVGAIIAPIAVPWIALTWGWRWAFIATGAVGFIWLLFWLAGYRDPAGHPKVSASELAYIRSDPVEATTVVPWASLLRHRQTWAFIVGKSLTDPVWLFYLFWLPKFLDASWGVKLAGLAAPLVAIYVLADVGSVGGGWFSSRLISSGWSVNRSRKTAMAIAAVLILPTVFAPFAKSLWVAVGIVSVAAAAHQWWSCKPLHVGERHVPAARRRVSGGDRRVRWRDERDGDSSG